MEYLEFELPIKELEDQLQKCQIIGDESYKKVYDKKIENVFVNKFLEDQLEFRKKELKI